MSFNCFRSMSLYRDGRRKKKERKKEEEKKRRKKEQKKEKKCEQCQAIYVYYSILTFFFDFPLP